MSKQQAKQLFKDGETKWEEKTMHDLIDIVFSLTDIEGYYLRPNGFIRFKNGFQIAWKTLRNQTVGGTLWDTETKLWFSDHDMGNWVTPFYDLYGVVSAVNAVTNWSTVGGHGVNFAGTVRTFRPNSVKMSGSSVIVVGFGQWRKVG